jgi:hypothetical protein
MGLFLKIGRMLLLKFSISSKRWLNNGRIQDRNYKDQLWRMIPLKKIHHILWTKWNCQTIHYNWNIPLKQHNYTSKQNHFGKSKVHSQYKRPYQNVFGLRLLTQHIFHKHKSHMFKQWDVISFNMYIVPRCPILVTCSKFG